jgi:hypothetical protein
VQIAPSLLFASIGLSITIAACGGGNAAAPAAESPAAQPAPVATGPRGNGGAATLGAAPFTGEMKPIAASTMAADLQALGLDPKALPPLDKLEPDKLRRVMKTFTKSLGAVCTDCHVENDFRAPTPRKSIAARMWDHFVRDLAMEDGALVYCDSCHVGRLTPLLDRHDKKALSTWMEANYVDKMKKVDGKEHGCETCHGDPFEPKFLGSWAKPASTR